MGPKAFYLSANFHDEYRKAYLAGTRDFGEFTQSDHKTAQEAGLRVPYEVRLSFINGHGKRVTKTVYIAANSPAHVRALACQHDLTIVSIVPWHD